MRCRRHENGAVSPCAGKRLYAARTPPDSYKALASQVAAIGNNLNQLTRLANSTGKIENAQIAEANRMMQRIWQLMREGQ